MDNFDRGMQIPAQVGGPDLSDENMIVSDYPAEFVAKISRLEQQIAQVKERIARNERALSGKSYEDVNNKLAALEMTKINSQDPTMIWRWQQQRQDTNTANANVKSNEAAKFANTVDMWVNTRPAPTTEGIMQQISNINSAIRDGKNAGADVSGLVAKKEELEALVYGGGEQPANTDGKYVKGTAAERLNAEVEDTISGARNPDEIDQYIEKNKNILTPDQINKLKAKRRELENRKINAGVEDKISGARTSTEIARYIDQNKSVLTPEQINKLNDRRRELERKEAARASAEKFEQWLKDHGYKNGSKGISPKILTTLERQYGG